MKRYCIIYTNEKGECHIYNGKTYDTKIKALKDLWVISKRKHNDMVYDDWLKDNLFFELGKKFDDLTFDDIFNAVSYIKYKISKENMTASIVDDSREIFIKYAIEEIEVKY